MVENELQQTESVSDDMPSHGKMVYVTLFLLMIVLIASFGMKSSWQKYVSVKQVYVEGNSIIAKEEIVRLMNISPNVSMYDIDLSLLQKNILANSFVKSAVIHRDAPSSLRVVIEERKPIAILAASETYYIASDGTVLPYIASSDTYDIPVISGLDSLSGIKTGKKILNTDVQEALNIVNVCKYTGTEMFHLISEVRLRKGHDIVLYSFETGVPILFGRSDIVKKIVKLDVFWQKYIKNNETADIQYIDIRFDDQVVVSRKNS